MSRGNRSWSQRAIHLTFSVCERLAGRSPQQPRLLVVYDDKCSFCGRVLELFKSADVAGGLTFIGPDHPRAPKGYDYEAAMYVFDTQGHGFSGYDGFRELLRYLGLPRPLVWGLGLRPVACLGRIAYGWIARNRGSISRCRL